MSRVLASSMTAVQMESGKETRLSGAPAAKWGDGRSKLSPLANLGSSNKVVRICVEQLRAGLQTSRAGPRKAISPEPKAEESTSSGGSTPLEWQHQAWGHRPGLDPLVEATLQALAAVDEKPGWDPLAEATLQALQQTPIPRSCMLAKDLLGCWLDSYGNNVVVQSMNEQLTQLTVTLSRNPRPDIYLSMWTPGGGEWYCGEAKLDVDHLYNDSVTWIFPDGRRSVWVWQAFTLEALQMRGHAPPQDYSEPVEFVEVWVPVGVVY